MDETALSLAVHGDPWTQTERHPDGQRFRKAEDEAEAGRP
jgi:hypothetical protein